jgi:UDP-2,3-diacylglucosamine pyrophosphatase LpxH
MNDAVIMSDIHLGSLICNHEAALSVLTAIHDGRIETKKLILNGDVFDDHDFRRLNKNHWKVLSCIRKISDHVDVVWVVGNHDGPMDIISPLLGVESVNQLILSSGDKKFFVTHGDRYDEIIAKRPWLVKLGDQIYRFFQRIDKTQTLAKFMKRRSKIYLRSIGIVRRKSLADAKKFGVNGSICGHTHKPEISEANGLIYANSGCFTESPGHYLTVKDGIINLVSTQVEDGAGS